jgi:site-specific DNA-methyltransferase (adenine-specific)
MFCDAEGVTDWMRDVVLVGMEHVRIGQWRKLGGSPQFTGDRPGIGCEAIEIAHPPGRKRWNGGGRHAFWEFAIASGTRVHTTQKPLPLMEALVSDFTDAGELICDPFAGSGTTGVACIRLGRRFVGWERDPKYFAVAVKRLRAAREQLRIPLDVEPMGTQAALLPASPSTQEAPAAVDKEG